MNASIITCTGDTVGIINETDCFDLDSRSVVSMCQSRSIDNILLQSNGIPNFDRSIVGTRHKKVVIGSHDHSVNWALMFREMRDECTFRMPVLEGVRAIIVESKGLTGCRERKWFTEIRSVLNE